MMTFSMIVDAVLLMCETNYFIAFECVFTVLKLYPKKLRHRQFFTVDRRLHRQPSYFSEYKFATVIHTDISFFICNCTFLLFSFFIKIGSYI